MSQTRKTGWVLVLFLLMACRPEVQPAGLPEHPTYTPSSTSTPTYTASPPPTATPTYTASPPPTATPSPTAPLPPSAAPSPRTTPSTLFDGERAYQLVVAQTDFGFRPTGSPAGWATGDWIIEQLEAAGWLVETQEFPYGGVIVRNIIGKAPDSENKPAVILGAHYDTRMRADKDPERPDEPVMGANDGASGAAVLLELANVLEPDKIPFQVWLAFFDAEDNGNLDGWQWIVGSSYMASHLSVRPEYVIVVDMIGDADQQIFYEYNSDPELMAAVWKVAADLGFGDTIIPEYGYSILDDHTPFAQLGIPAVDMIDFDYPHHHTSGDTLDKVSAISLERVGRTLETFLESRSVVGDGND